MTTGYAQQKRSCCDILRYNGRPITKNAMIQDTTTTQYTQMPPKPDNNLVLAILTTVCCCLPFGIVGIVMASKVNGLYLAGQYEAAEKAAKDAKKWSLIGIACGVVIGIIYMAIYGVAMFAALNQ